MDVFVHTTTSMECRAAMGSRARYGEGARAPFNALVTASSRGDLVCIYGDYWYSCILSLYVGCCRYQVPGNRYEYRIPVAVQLYAIPEPVSRRKRKRRPEGRHFFDVAIACALSRVCAPRWPGDRGAGRSCGRDGPGGGRFDRLRSGRHVARSRRPRD